MYCFLQSLPQVNTLLSKSHKTKKHCLLRVNLNVESSNTYIGLTVVLFIIDRLIDTLHGFLLTCSHCYAFQNGMLICATVFIRIIKFNPIISYIYEQSFIICWMNVAIKKPRLCPLDTRCCKFYPCGTDLFLFSHLLALLFKL
mgnify:CR=1 FL=1